MWPDISMDIQPSKPAVSASYLPVICNALASKGLDKAQIETLIERANIDPELATLDGSFLSISQYQILIREALKLTDDPILGLYIGQFFEVGTHGILSYAALGMPRVWDCLKLGEKFARLRSPILKVKLTLHDEVAVIRIDTNAFEGDVYRFVIEGAICSYFAILKLVFEQALPKTKVYVSYQNPLSKSHSREYQTELGQDILFKQAANEIHLPRQAVEKVLSTANPEIALELDQRINALLKPLEETSIEAQVRELLANSLGFVPSQQTIAQHLNISTRSLRRRLHDRGYSYQVLVNDFRKELAFEFLAKPAHSIEEIAYFLGFSSASHFSNSFKKWTGLSPGHYRTKTNAQRLGH